MKTNTDSLNVGYVLHSRAYRDSSLLVDVFTQSVGRLSLVAKGAKQGKNNQARLLQPFRRLCFSWSGRSELKTLRNLEESGPALLLAGKNMLCSYYLNELILRLLPTYDAQPELFDIYDNCISGLGMNPLHESGETTFTEKSRATWWLLRLFEKRMLEDLGYGLPLEWDSVNQERIRTGFRYSFDLERWAVVPYVAPRMSSQAVIPVHGETLLKLAGHELEITKRVLGEARCLMRAALRVHLGGRPLKSRTMYQELLKMNNQQELSV